MKLTPSVEHCDGGVLELTTVPAVTGVAVPLVDIAVTVLAGLFAANVIVPFAAVTPVAFTAPPFAVVPVLRLKTVVLFISTLLF